MRITAQNILKLTAILTIACLSSCKQLHTKKELTELYGLKIEIPKDMPVTIDGKDSIIQEQAGAYATMVIWYDSLQCVSCYMGFIDAWKQFFEYSRDSVDGFGPVLILVPPKRNIVEFEETLKKSHYKFPINVDYSYKFCNLNPKIVSSDCQNVFLLDKNHEIVLVGNPFYNNSMMRLYKRTINVLIANQGVIPKLLY